MDGQKIDQSRAVCESQQTPQNQNTRRMRVLECSSARGDSRCAEHTRVQLGHAPPFFSKVQSYCPGSGKAILHPQRLKMLESQIYPGGALRREVRAVAAVAAEIPRLLQVEQTPRACSAVRPRTGQAVTLSTRHVVGSRARAQQARRACWCLSRGTGGGTRRPRGG